MLTCNCVAAEEFTKYFNRLQYGLSDSRCEDYIKKVKIAQILKFMESISSVDCDKPMRCLYDKLNCQ